MIKAAVREFVRVNLTKNNILSGARIMLRYALMPLMFVYTEFLLRMLTHGNLFNGFSVTVLFLLAAGFFLNLIITVTGRLLPVRIFGAIVLFFTGLIYILQYFMYKAFNCFMPISTITEEARNVLNNFTSTFIAAIIRGFPVIFAFAVPFILFLILNMKKINFFEADIDGEQKTFSGLRGHLKTRLTTIIICSALFITTTAGCLLTVLLDAGYKAAVSSEFNFDSSSRQIGIIPGVSIDIKNNIFGNTFDSSSATFAYVPQLPPIDTAGQTAMPSQTGNMQSSQKQSDTGNAAAHPGSAEASPQPEPAPTPVIYGYNVLDIDFDTLIENEKKESIRKVHEYVSALTPSRQNAYTGIFEGKNLIIICAEALTKQVIDPVMTPTLYRLAHNGFYFSDFYQPGWGGGTAGGEFSILAGLPPVKSSGSTHLVAEKNTSFMIGKMLENKNYFTASFHNGSHTYYRRDESHPQIGYDPYIAFGSGLQQLMEKGSHRASDLDLMIATVPYYIDNSPFSVYYMTYSGHANYAKGNPMSKKNWDAFPEQYSQMEYPIRAYMAANLEFEHAMTHLVEQLESKGIADDTVIVIASDHFPYGLMRSEIWDSDEDYLSMLYGVDRVTQNIRDESVLILWSGSLENEYKDMAAEISGPASTLDILPTLLNLFGLEYDSRLYIGRDVFSDELPLVFWLNRSWATPLGVYDASNKKFTPAGNTELTDEYREAVAAIINNKIAFAKAVIENNYYGTLFDDNGMLLG